MVLFRKFLNNDCVRGYTQENPFQKERLLLGDAIKELRKRKSMTQEDLAHEADINVSYLAKIENGYVNTTLRYLIKIAQGLNVQARDLIKF